MKQIITSRTLLSAVPPATLLIMLLVSAFTQPAWSRDSGKETNGVVIEDIEPYPMYQYSQRINPDGAPALVLHINQQEISSTVVSILDKSGIPYQALSKSPATFQTDWISWHYDTKTKKTLSQPGNRFFKQHTRDKYKFRLSIHYIEQQPIIMLDEVKRRELVDITADTEISWYEWKPEEPQPEAIKAFLQRLQTEHEIAMLQSVHPVVAVSAAAVTPGPVVATGPITTSPVVAAPAVREEAPAQKASQTFSNYISMNLDASQNWAQTIRQLKLKSIPLSIVHNEQQMLSSDWVYAEFKANIKQLDTASRDVQRHKFQLMIIPGSTSQTSSVFVYHTAFQQKAGQSTWSDKETQQEIANAFLTFLDLNQ